jgi:hypothetical protein
MRNHKIMLTRRFNPTPVLITTLLLMLGAQAVRAQTTAFTYQGKLSDGGNPAAGTYDFQVKLFDTAALGTGTQQGITVTLSNITVTGGLFTLPVDFAACPSCFNGATRFLEIAVKLTSNPTLTTLSPRQPLTSTPYAIRSLNATTADGLSLACLSCITSSQIQSVSGSAVTGTIPLASLPAGSANYIQNTASPQASSNFNISGNGTAGGTLSANVIESATQFNLAGNRILSNPGTNNLFVGVQAGAVNSTGQDNVFFGLQAGSANTMGSDNSFFGYQTGLFNTTGSQNAFFGYGAGFGNTTGKFNSFFGSEAGESNTTGGSNTMIGNFADVGFSNLDHATAIGAEAIVTASNQVQIGRIGLDKVAIGAFAMPSTSTAVCINNLGVFTACSSSRRYKDNVQSFTQGLNLIQGLRPVTFNWKEGHAPDLGLIAEEVAEVEPLLTIYNNKGEIEGVKYAQLNVVLINAIKEQQTQIENQQTQIREHERQAASQQTQIEQSRKQLAAQQARITEQEVKLAQQQRDLGALKQLLCRAHPRAEICRAARPKK